MRWDDNLSAPSPPQNSSTRQDTYRSLRREHFPLSSHFTGYSDNLSSICRSRYLKKSYEAAVTITSLTNGNETSIPSRWGDWFSPLCWIVEQNSQIWKEAISASWTDNHLTENSPTLLCPILNQPQTAVVSSFTDVFQLPSGSVTEMISDWNCLLWRFGGLPENSYPESQKWYFVGADVPPEHKKDRSQGHVHSISQIYQRFEKQYFWWTNMNTRFHDRMNRLWSMLWQETEREWPHFLCLSKSRREFNTAKCPAFRPDCLPSLLHCNYCRRSSSDAHKGQLC